MKHVLYISKNIIQGFNSQIFFTLLLIVSLKLFFPAIFKDLLVL